MDNPIFDNKHYNTPGQAHELTYSCYRKLPWFIDEVACRIFLDSVRLSQRKFRFHLWAYVVMPDHVHLLIWPLERGYDIAKVLQAINGVTSHRYSRLLARINPDLRSKYMEKKSNREIFRFWQRGGGFDRNLHNDAAIHACIRYIENNPVRSRHVGQANEYRWSSACTLDCNEKWRPKVDRSSVPVRMVYRH
jgi:putative transposase